MNDYYVDASYLVWRRPDVRFGYGLSQTMFSAAAPDACNVVPKNRKARVVAA